MADKKQETIADIRQDAETKFREMVKAWIEGPKKFRTTLGAMVAFNTVFDRLEAAHRREMKSIERIVRDAIIDYTEQYPHAPNDDVERELIARAKTANEWLKQYGFAEEPTNWSKEEMPCL